MKHLSILLTLLISFAFQVHAVDPASKIAILRDLYYLQPGEEIRDITDKLLASTDTHPKVKSQIQSSNRKFYLFNYPSGGIKVKGYISFTPNSVNKPLLIVLRGGMDLMGIMNPASDFSTHGDYSVLATAYRGTIFEGTDEFGGADVLDVKTLIDFFPKVQETLGIDLRPSKTFMLGGSRGAMQMILALTRYPELQNKVDKIVALSGLFNLPKWFEKANPYFDKYKDPTGKYPNNPIKVVTQIRKDLPFLIIQGTKDTVVPLNQGKEMLNLLKRSQHAVDYFERTEGTHTLSNFPFIRMGYITAWLEK